MNHRVLVHSVLALFCLLQIKESAAQGPPDPWYGRSSKPKDFEAFKLPLVKYDIELPKDWQVVPGHSQILFTATEKTRNNRSAAAIVLEHLQLRSALALTPAVAEVELTTIKEREPSGQDFSQQLMRVGGRQFVLIQFTRPGHTGPDRVVQYSILADSIMYRLMCIISLPQLAKYQQICAHVAASFAVRGSASD